MSLPLQCIIGLIASALVCCAAPEATSPPASYEAKAQSDIPLPQFTSNIGQKSCPDGIKHIDPIAIEIDASEIGLSKYPRASDLPAGVTFAGGWHLTSPHAGFGGLSGLEQLSEGTLLAVSDEGAFVWIDIMDDQPSGSGKMAYMRNADGNYLRGKNDADSEGLALKDGLVLVSFERRHRIEAFDLAGCGAAARAVPVTSLPDTFGDDAVKENSGPEALTVVDGKLLAGYEQVIAHKSPLITLEGPDMSVTMPDPIDTRHDGPLVGLSTLTLTETGTSVTYALRRRYNPLSGNLITIEAWWKNAEGIEARVPVFRLAVPMTVDNFEGITATQGEDGTHRIWLISDDNFSRRQRTLLFAFDVKAPSF